jgi:hypothetical protein
MTAGADQNRLGRRLLKSIAGAVAVAGLYTLWLVYCYDGKAALDIMPFIGRGAGSLQSYIVVRWFLAPFDPIFWTVILVVCIAYFVARINLGRSSSQPR